MVNLAPTIAIITLNAIALNTAIKGKNRGVGLKGRLNYMLLTRNSLHQSKHGAKMKDIGDVPCEWK